MIAPQDFEVWLPLIAKIAGAAFGLKKLADYASAPSTQMSKEALVRLVRFLNEKCSGPQFLTDEANVIIQESEINREERSLQNRKRRETLKSALQQFNEEADKQAEAGLSAIDNQVAESETVRVCELLAKSRIVLHEEQFRAAKD